MLYKSSSNSPFAQILQIRGGKTYADLAYTEVGVQNLGKPADVILERSPIIEHSLMFKGPVIFILCIFQLAVLLPGGEILPHG